MVHYKNSDLTKNISRSFFFGYVHDSFVKDSCSRLVYHDDGPGVRVHIQKLDRDGETESYWKKSIKVWRGTARVE